MKVVNLHVKLYISDDRDAYEVIEEMTYDFDHEAIQLTEIAEILSVKQTDFAG